ncbi:MAG: M15 family metallopeptidase [Gammaproteobacteria bacterium]|nr:M15 family metallopeptidase [Gammaproteobacteria bacterium]
MNPDHSLALDLLTDVTALSQTKCTRPILAKLAYATKDNFMGREANGYSAAASDFALMTKTAALALCKVQNQLLEEHELSLLIYDSYRPKRAVLDFISWTNDAPKNQHELAMKQKHYPHIRKNQLFELGYLSADSQHCYGHTVDLVLIDKNQTEIPLGACFDFMDELSHLSAMPDQIGHDAFNNRQILSQAMQQQGFVPYQFEFWHFNYKDREINHPIDLEITADLKNINTN